MVAFYFPIDLIHAFDMLCSAGDSGSLFGVVDGFGHLDPAFYSWQVDEIPLSRPKRNISRDFADGAGMPRIELRICQSS